MKMIKTETLKKSVLLAVVILFSFTSLAQIKEGDVIFPYKIDFGGDELILNGTGMREMFFIDLYAGGLYLKRKSNDAMAIANDPETMGIKIKIVSRLVTQDKMIKAVYDGFDKATYGNTDSLKSRIEVFISFFSEPIVEGDEFDIVYIKGEGSKCFKNGKELGSVEGEDFKFALFKIWLGEKPASKPLKEGMLGL